MKRTLSQALDAAHPLEKYRDVVFLCLVLAIALIPVFLAKHPPLADYPNHLARAYIIANHETVPEFQEVYDVRWSVLPNLSMDIFVPVLARFTDVFTAGQVFVALTLVTLVVGCALMNRTMYGRLSLGAALSGCILYNLILSWGFLNYLFSLGLCLITFHFYLAYRRQYLKQLLVCAPLCLALFFSHLYGFCVYGVLVIAHALSETPLGQERSRLLGLARVLAKAAAQAVLPILLFLFYSDTATATPLYYYGGIGQKLFGFAYLFLSYNPKVDIVCLVALVILILYKSDRKTLRIANYALGAIVFLCALYLAMPSVVLSSAIADRRLLVAIGFIAAASLGLRSRTSGEWVLTASAILLVICLQVATAAASWAASEKRLSPYLSAFALIEPGSTVSLAIDKEVNWLPITMRHVASYLVIYRHAFAPNIFASKGQQPLSLTPEYEALRKDLDVAENFTFLLKENLETGAGDAAERIRARFSGYDYLLVMWAAPYGPESLSQDLEVVYRGPDFLMYDLRQRSASGPWPRTPPPGASRSETSG